MENRKGKWQLFSSNKENSNSNSTNTVLNTSSGTATPKNANTNLFTALGKCLKFKFRKRQNELLPNGNVVSANYLAQHQNSAIANTYVEVPREEEDGIHLDDVNSRLYSNYSVRQVACNSTITSNMTQLFGTEENEMAEARRLLSKYEI